MVTDVMVGVNLNDEMVMETEMATETEIEIEMVMETETETETEMAVDEDEEVDDDEDDDHEMVMETVDEKSSDEMTMMSVMSDEWHMRDSVWNEYLNVPMSIHHQSMCENIYHSDGI